MRTVNIRASSIAACRGESREGRTKGEWVNRERDKERNVRSKGECSQGCVDRCVNNTKEQKVAVMDENDMSQ